VVEEPLRVLRWDVETLERYLVANPEVRIVLQRHLARDLARRGAPEKHRLAKNRHFTNNCPSGGLFRVVGETACLQQLLL
jgi:hypothetical protein